MTRLIILGIVLVLSIANFTACNAQSREGVNYVDATEFRQEISNNDVIVLDVRTAQEFNSGHIEGAINIDYTSSGFAEKVNELEKDKPVLVYCRSGKRSEGAIKIMQENGFTDITSLQKGIIEWQQKGYPTMQ